MSTKPGPNANQFLNGPNYQRIVGFLRQQYVQKLGTNALPERMDTRLQKTVQHYMAEIDRAQAGKPVPALNQEVLRESMSSIDAWLKKQEPAGPSSASSAFPSPAFPANGGDTRLFEDTSTRYESMMAERTPPVQFAPPPQDFRQPLYESEEDPVVLMQRMQKQREDQARSKLPRLEITETASSNPVPPQATAAPELLAPRPQDYIIPQEDVVKYRETEYNIFLTSSDRDWLRNTAESRYNFSVNFNTGSKRIGYPFNAALQERFRNIQRIEFVKAILPIESLVALPRATANTGNGVYDVTRVINVFSLPFMGVRIAELNNNGFSTKPEEDNTFAIVQYDTTWGSDLSAPVPAASLGGAAPGSLAPMTKSGYTGVIPKFLKTQKVYTPTPLATLQKLSIRMETHEGSLLSSDSDVWTIRRVCLSSSLNSLTVSAPSFNTNYQDPASGGNYANSYIFVQTNAFFMFSAISEGDHIQFQGYAPTTTSPAATDFASFLNRSAGHYVVATAYTAVNASGVPSTSVTDGRNAAGYCNVIILRSRFNDPSTGSVSRENALFGGNETGLAAALNGEANQTGAALINLSRQTHVVLRLITRDMDSSSNIRPDNV